MSRDWKVHLIDAGGVGHSVRVVDGVETREGAIAAAEQTLVGRGIPSPFELSWAESVRPIAGAAA